MERSYGSFQRSFQLDSNIDDGKIAATFEKGVLKITLPKRPDAVKTEKRIGSRSAKLAVEFGTDWQVVGPEFSSSPRKSGAPIPPAVPE